MKDFINKIISALDNHSKGFSARKLSAFVIIIMVVVLHVKWFASDRWEFLGEVLALDFGFISVCLGMTTYEAIKNKEENNKP
jgi:hypothetical protein